MDDCLQSFKTTETAAITATEVKDTLQKGGFKLTKFFSNDPNTVMKITGGNADTAIEQRILGQMWNAKEDIFIFKRPDLKLDVKSMQQRQLLSLAASLFDPLGIITPFSIRVRCILQSIVKQGNNWNNQISREFQHDLQQSVDEYEQMPETSISRCLIPNPDAKHELHIFCDASSTAITTTIKTTTIPKLELEAAAMGAELASFVRSEMPAHFDKIQFWTDSMATLGWIKSTKHQKVFVANRIAKILASSKSEQWNFVPGKINPADHGTRGLSLTDLKEKWLSAPKILLENPVPNFQRDQQFTETNVLGTETSNTVIDTDDFSSWNNLMRLTETVMNAVNIFRKRPVTNSYEDKRRHLLRQSQHKTFSDSIRYLERGNELDKRDKLLQFTPFLDKDGLIRARGRLKHAKIPYNQKHPNILDSKNSITKLMIEQAHNDCRHLGTKFVREHQQQDFIIIGQRRFLKQLSKTCFICRRWRAQKYYPLMADLPSFQFAEAEKQYVFLNVGLDFFGPFYVEHRNRKLEKQYVCLFTCLVTRAVHLEVCQTLDTDSCLLTIRRFVSRRGYP